MLEDSQNNTRKEHTKYFLLKITNLRTQQLSESYGTESSALCIEVTAICDLSNFFVIVLISSPTECRVTLNIELNYMFAMAQYGVVCSEVHERMIALRLP
jgi:hypothetical protein